MFEYLYVSVLPAFSITVVTNLTAYLSAPKLSNRMAQLRPPGDDHPFHVTKASIMCGVPRERKVSLQALTILRIMIGKSRRLR